MSIKAFKYVLSYTRSNGNSNSDIIDLILRFSSLQDDTTFRSNISLPNCNLQTLSITNNDADKKVRKLINAKIRRPNGMKEYSPNSINSSKLVSQLKSENP